MGRWQLARKHRLGPQGQSPGLEGGTGVPSHQAVAFFSVPSCKHTCKGNLVCPLMATPGGLSQPKPQC